MTVQLLTEHLLEFLSLKGGCTGSSESALVKVPHCWVSHVTAHLLIVAEIINVPMPEKTRLYLCMLVRSFILPNDRFYRKGANTYICVFYLILYIP